MKKLTSLLAVILAAFGSSPTMAQSACSQSLQSRVDQAAPGATLDVPPCTYRETVMIGKAITLDGHGKASIDGENIRDRWMWIGTSNVTIRGFKMFNANTANQEGAIGTQSGSSNIVIDGNDLGATRGGEQIGIGETSNSKVINNQIHGGGQMGIGTYLNTGLLIQGNHIYGNNTAGVDPFWAAGGIKAVAETNSKIMSNEVDHNVGPGIWCDISCDGVTIANNSVHDTNGWNPIFYEISSNGDIYGNTIVNGTPGNGDWGCITLATSASTRVHDNTCTDTLPLRAQLDNRGDAPPGAGTGNRLENNRLVRPQPNQATSWWQYDPNGPLVPGTNGNVDAGNLIVNSLSTPTPVPTVTPIATPTMTCQVEVWLNGVSQGRKGC